MMCSEKGPTLKGKDVLTRGAKSPFRVVHFHTRLDVQKSKEEVTKVVAVFSPLKSPLHV